MNKGDLKVVVAKECGMTKAVADQALNGVLSAITEAVTAGDKVNLIGFGTFSVADRLAHEGCNPQSGETIRISARKVIKFKVGKNLVDPVK